MKTSATPFGVRIATSVELRHSPSAKAASGTTPTSMPSSARVRPARSPGSAADQVGEDPVGIDDLPVAVAVHDEVAERVDQAAEAFLAFLQLPHAVGERLVLGEAALRGRVERRGKPAFGAQGERKQRQRARPMPKSAMGMRPGAPSR